MEIRRLNTHGEVIDEIGVERFIEIVSTPKKPRTGKHVSNYRCMKFFPSDTFLAVTEELKKKHCEAPPKLWGMVEPKKDPPKRHALLKRAS